MEIYVDLYFVLFFIFFFLAILCFIFVYLIVKRLIEVAKVQKKKQYIHKYKDTLYAYLLRDEKLSRNLIPTTSWKLAGIEQMLNSYIKNIKSDAMLLKVKEYAEKYLREHYRDCLASKRWSIRMNALYYIVEFQVQSLVTDIEAMLENGKRYDDDERFQMYRALVKLKDSHANHRFFMEETMFTEYEYRKLLVELSEQQLGRLMASKEELPYALLLTVIDMIGLRKLEQFSDFLERGLEHDDLEVRIRCLKAFHELPTLHRVENLLRFIDSEHWQERMLIVRLLEKVERTEAERYLLELMKDSSWWVRSQAARSLLTFKDGKKTLGQLVKNSDDRFAANMAEEVLKKVY